MLVPPMSNDTASRKPHASATKAAACTPATGPDRSNEAGRLTASSSGTRPPADVITKTSFASDASPGRYARQTGCSAASATVVTMPFVLAKLGRDLVGAHHVEAR